MNKMFWAITAMMLVVASSNYLVQFPIGDYLTWGAFTYPFAFLVTDLTNRLLGPQCARQVVYIGFALGVALSFYLATPRIALASGTAFLVGQLLDITVFNRLRGLNWWKAPLFASAAGSVIDTALFFSLAFAGTELNWLALAAGDLCVKLALALMLLAPFRLVIARWSTAYAR